MSLPSLILAAGRSQRMGRIKALLSLNGKTFLEDLVETLAAQTDPVLVVLGCHKKAIRDLMPSDLPARFVVNPDYELGMLSSLQTGLRALPKDAPGVVFTLVDHPGLRPQTLRTLLEAFDSGDEPIVIPRLQGERGHPVLLRRAIVEELLALPAEASAKDVIRSYRDQTLFVDVEDPAVTADVDRPEDYRRLLELTSRSASAANG